jgi:PAS domain S-box-containing protein
MGNVIKLPREATAEREEPDSDAHLLQFYEREEHLYDAVARYLDEGLDTGDRLLLIATPEHTSEFLARLPASAAERATLLDARETLESIVVDGMPDATRFRDLLRRALDKARGGQPGARVRAYGEMIDLLWREGRVEAAIQLEELWNEARVDPRFSRICNAHARVLPSEGRAEAGLLEHRVRALETEIAHRERLETALRAALSARHAARAEAEAERLRLYEVLTHAPMAVLVLRAADGVIELANARCEQLLGGASVVGQRVVDVFPELTKGAAAQALDRVVATGTPLSVGELRVVIHGVERYVSASVVALRDHAGAIDRVIAVAVDVTEQVTLRRALTTQNERKVAASEERFKLLVASVKDYAIFILDPNGNVATWNEGARRIKGYEADEIIGRHFSTFYPPEDAATGRWERELEIAATEGRFEEEGLRVRKDGTQFWANIILTALRDEAGKLVGFAKVTRDLTERRRAELERRRLAEAQAASRAKDQFLATVSHELRTPLNAVLGHAVLMREFDLPLEVRRGLQVIERNARTQARLIEDVLDLSRIVSGTLRLNFQRMSVEEAVAAALDTVRPTADAKGVGLSSMTPSRTLWMYADPERVQQILWNLATNAVKFTQSGGRVEVEVSASDGQLHMSVKDNGRGISPDFLPHLFTPFQQADGTPTRRSGGLGLGLSIVRHLVEAHGGTIEVHSDGEGKGSTFRVHMPLGDARERAAGTGPLRPGGTIATRLDGVRVLVVDDDEDTRELAGEILRAAGADVVPAASAAEAMELVQANRPDVVVSDIGMPDVDGYAFVRKLRSLSHERGGRIPAIALTAYARREDEQAAYGAGYQAYAAKPIDPAHLVMLVSSFALMA